jgi:hypothetical protein
MILSFELSSALEQVCSADDAGQKLHRTICVIGEICAEILMILPVGVRERGISGGQQKSPQET